jgi:hypothetical protein
MDRRFADYDDDMMSEAAVERWLTSPSSVTTSQYGNSKIASPTTSISGFGGSRHSHAGVFSASDVDSATRSMSMAAANALAEARTTLSSPGGQNIANTASTSPAGRAILRERLRQRVKKNGGGGSGARVLERPSAVETKVSERRASSQAGTSTISISSSVTPQHRLESLLHDKGFMLQASTNKQREPTTPSTSSSNYSSPTNSDFLKAFLAGGDLDGASPLSDSALRTRLEALAVSRVRSANTSSKANSQHRNSGASDREMEEEMLVREIAVLALSSNSGTRDASAQSSLLSRRKSSNAAPAVGSLSAPSSPRRRSSYRRQSSHPIAVNPVDDDSAARDGGNGQRHVVVSTSPRGENRIFFARSNGDSPNSRSTKSGAIIPLQRQQDDANNDEPTGPKVTPSTSQRNFASLREVKTFSPKGSANLPASKPKNRQATKTVVTSMVVEAREQSEGFHQKLRRQVKHDPRQGFVPPSRTNRIRLHVYDLIAQETVVQLPWGCHFPIGQCFSVVNSSLHELGTGAYHVGVEVRGKRSHKTVLTPSRRRELTLLRFVCSLLVIVC